MKRRLVLLWDAYVHSIFVAGVVLDALFCALVFADTSTNMAPLSGLFLMRLILLVLVLYLYRLITGSKTFAYYRNLGFSKRQLLVGIGLLDYAIATALITVCYVC